MFTISKNKKVVTCDIAGAKFISRDSYSRYPCIFTGKTGLIKKHGCVMFRGNRKSSYFGEIMCQEDCLARFYDKCPASQAWLVVPSGKDYDWYRVDHLIDFS